MSTIPKSKKLVKETIEDSSKPNRKIDLPAAKPLGDGPIQIKPIECCNENVAILCFRTEVGGNLVLPEDDGFKEEGIVVGIGPGIPDGAGGRTRSQLQLGDVVTFQKRQILNKIKSQTGFYKDQLLLIINERSLLIKLPQVPYEIVD
jgi:co-chaperonin GroES (HSP10)